MREMETLKEAEKAGEFDDWEVVPKSDDTTLVADSSLSVSVVVDSSLDGEGMFRPDYFSLCNHCRYGESVVQGDVSDKGSNDSDNPSSWIDSDVIDLGGGAKNPAESDRLDELKIGGFDGNRELGLAETVKSDLGLGETVMGSGVSGLFRPDSESKVSDLNSIDELGFAEKPKPLVGFAEHIRRGERSNRAFSDGEIAEGNDEMKPGMSSDLDGGDQVQGGVECGTEEQSSGLTKVIPDFVNSPGDGEKMRIVWWKVPFEVLRYCVCRVSPLWSFSIAAAFVGFVFLGRRLYKMKKKSPGLQLKVTMDDKKVSQFMTRTARLNEVFSVVMRVPVTRPVLPVTGVNHLGL